jgi:hypothetical protein
MGTTRDFVAALIKSGPENINAAIKAIEKLPSDTTMNRAIDKVDQVMPTIQQILPYLSTLSQLASIMSPQNMQTLQGLSKNLPDKETMDRLARLLPYLDKLPDKETLKALLDKADALTALLTN